MVADKFRQSLHNDALIAFQAVQLTTEAVHPRLQQIVENPGANDGGVIQQGFLETSNVNVVNEITNLITAQRAYEMNSKVIEAADQMQQTLSNLH